MSPIVGRSFLALAIVASLTAAGCGGSAPARNDGGSGGSGAGTGGQPGTGGAGRDGGGGSSPTDGGASGSDAPLLTGCVDKVTADNTTPAIVNLPNGFCDTYGSFTLTASAAGAPAATNVTLFRTDATGLNLMASGDHFSRGVWTTQLAAMNVPGNYVVHLFIAKVPNPAPTDFVALTGALSLPLAAGDNKFYFFADRDDTAGGDAGFGLNVWLAAAAAGSPTLSGFMAVPGGTLMADETTGCSPAYDGSCGVSAKALATGSGTTVTLTSFVVGGVGGAAAPADAGAGD
jgi:hypothetical protein